MQCKTPQNAYTNYHIDDNVDETIRSLYISSSYPCPPSPTLFPLIFSLTLPFPSLSSLTPLAPLPPSFLTPPDLSPSSPCSPSLIFPAPFLPSPTQRPFPAHPPMLRNGEALDFASEGEGGALMTNEDVAPRPLRHLGRLARERFWRSAKLHQFSFNSLIKSLTQTIYLGALNYHG